MQEEFRELVEETVSLCKEYFRQKMAAMYLHGSIYYGDAVPGISDMDCIIVLNEKPYAEEKEWLCASADRLNMKYPVVDGVHISAYDIDSLRADKWARFMLKYNASLYAGTDVVREMYSENISQYYPDKRTARARLGFAVKCFEDAWDGKQPASTGEIPQDTCYAARKFARYFVIIEGAYWLMSQNQFKSFAKEDVLSGLRENCRQFRSVFDLTEKILQSPLDAGINHVAYLKQIKPFMEWIFESIAVINEGIS